MTLRGLLLGIAAGGVLTAGVPAAAVAPRGTRSTAGPGWFLPEGRPSRSATAAERIIADGFVRRARAAVSRWADPAAAMAAGFAPASQGVVVHYLDARRAVLPGDLPDPARPTALIFVLGGRAPRLAGAMWMMEAPGQPGVTFAGPLTAWHAHVTCRRRWTMRIAPASGRCRPGEAREVSPEMLHVWVAGDPFASDMTSPALWCTLARWGL